mgnify:CR=1 FL=1
MRKSKKRYVLYRACGDKSSSEKKTRTICYQGCAPLFQLTSKLYPHISVCVSVSIKTPMVRHIHRPKAHIDNLRLFQYRHWTMLNFSSLTLYTSNILLSHYTPVIYTSKECTLAQFSCGSMAAIRRESEP